MLVVTISACSGLYLIAFGRVGVKSSLLPFGACQFDDENPVDREKSVGREEIEEMEEGCTETGRQRSKDGALKQAKYAPGRPVVDRGHGSVDGACPTPLAQKGAI